MGRVAVANLGQRDAGAARAADEERRALAERGERGAALGEHDERQPAAQRVDWHRARRLVLRRAAPRDETRTGQDSQLSGGAR